MCLMPWQNFGEQDDKSRWFTDVVACGTVRHTLNGDSDGRGEDSEASVGTRIRLAFAGVDPGALRFIGQCRSPGRVGPSNVVGLHTGVEAVKRYEFLVLAPTTGAAYSYARARWGHSAAMVASAPVNSVGILLNDVRGATCILVDGVKERADWPELASALEAAGVKSFEYVAITADVRREVSPPEPVAPPPAEPPLTAIELATLRAAAEDAKLPMVRATLEKAARLLSGARR